MRVDKNFCLLSFCIGAPASVLSFCLHTYCVYCADFFVFSFFPYSQAFRVIFYRYVYRFYYLIRQSLFLFVYPDACTLQTKEAARINLVRAASFVLFFNTFVSYLSYFIHSLIFI